MKNNLILSVIVALLIAVSHSSTASPFDNKPMLVHLRKSDEAKKLELRVGNLQNQTTYISIQNLDGQIVYSFTIKNQDHYLKVLNLTQVAKGEYILLIENESNRYIRAFSMSDKDVALYQNERRPKSEAQYVDFNGGSNGLLNKMKKDKKDKIVFGLVKSLEKTASNINFFFIETPERTYFQFFTISDEGVTIGNSQNIMKNGKTKVNNMAAVYKK